MVDTLIDTHFHYQGKKVAVFGDPDIVIPPTEFLLTMGMKPVYVMTGTPGPQFETKVNRMLDVAGIAERKVKAEGDLFDLHQWIKQSPVDLLVGTRMANTSPGRRTSPWSGVGFPVLDRAVHPLMPIVGYRGSMRLIEMISNTLLERRDRDSLDEDFELVL